EESRGEDDEDDDSSGRSRRTRPRAKKRRYGESSWVEMSIDIPGVRDDEALPVYLAEMMRETLVNAENGPGGVAALEGAASDADADTPRSLRERLVINDGWHWRLYID
ncbi:hypothetical protein KEM52_004534, partial [Ascosphaera acerosa]